MKRVSVGLMAVVVGLFGSGRADRDAENTAGNDDRTAEVRPVPVNETGCLTARGDQFVLTDLERGEGATTETFQLVGNEAELRQHVGKQVRVNGEAEAPKVAVVQESTPPPSDSRPQGTTGSTDPKVTSQVQTRMEVRKLTVTSVEPTGANCAEEGKSGGSAPRQ
jgi:hypothetical protein